MNDLKPIEPGCLCLIHGVKENPEVVYTNGHPNGKIVTAVKKSCGVDLAGRWVTGWEIDPPSEILIKGHPHVYHGMEEKNLMRIDPDEDQKEMFEQELLEELA